MSFDTKEDKIEGSLRSLQNTTNTKSVTLLKGHVFNHTLGPLLYFIPTQSKHFAFNLPERL